MEEMDYRRVLVERLAQIEKRHDVNALTYKGLRIWPLLRGQLGAACENEFLLDGRHVGPHILRTLPQRFELNRSIHTALNSDESLEKPMIIGEDGLTLESLSGQSPCLFFSRRVRHFRTNGGRFTDHQEDSTFDLLKNKFGCLKIEGLEKFTPETIPREVAPVCFKTPWENSMARFRAFYASHFPAWPERQETEKFMKSARTMLKLDAAAVPVDDIEMMLYYIEANMRLHLKFLTAIRPKAIFVGLHLAPEAMGLIAAAKRLSIPTIEIQHGLIGRYQWFQTHYTKIPAEGYDLMPDYFWVWDETTKQDTEREMPTVSGAHRAIIGGNPALELWATTKKPPAGGYQTLFFDGLTRQRHVILIALQYYSLAPDNIVKAMKRAPKDWLWLIRLHPMSRPLQDVVKEVYQSHGLDNVEVFHATETPLYDMLQHVDHIVTPFSTTALEAHHFNVPVTLTEKISVDVFSGFNFDNLGFADDPEEICARISKCRNAAAEDRRNRPMRSVVPRATAAMAEIIADWESRRNETGSRAARLSRIPIFADPPVSFVTPKSSSPPTRTPMMDRVVKLAQLNLSEDTLKRLTPLSKSIRRLERRLLNR